MSRRYLIWNTSVEGEIVAWFVTDQTQEEHDLNRKKHGNNYLCETVRPRIATFPVSPLYPRGEQERRAKMLCDYLNKIQEARDQAESQTAFVDLLTAQAPTNP